MRNILPKQNLIPFSDGDNYYSMGKKGFIRIGISNVVVPGNKQAFPPAFQLTSRLHYYSSIFNTVEINKSFYKTPLFSTYEKWSKDTPGDFRFSLKMSKEITHAKDLQSDLLCMQPFMRSATGIGPKKGCLLLQFPGKITLDFFDKVENILGELRQLDLTHQWRTAVEFRNDSWYTGETNELLDEYKAVMVLHDFKKGKHFSLSGDADFAYIRFHGPNGDYRDSYTDQFLKSKACIVRQWQQEGKDIYVYFNNTMGNAFDNALTMKAMLEQ